MIVGFTGTQAGMTAAQMQAVVTLLVQLRPEEVHHGDCIGADEDFHHICLAMESGIRIVIHPPISSHKRANCPLANEILPVKPYLDRNHDIVNAVDAMIATPKEFEEVLRSGTWATIRYTKKNRDKRLYVVWPDGSQS